MDPADGMYFNVVVDFTARSLYHFTQQGDWKEALTSVEIRCSGDSAEDSDEVQQDLQLLAVVLWHWCEMVLVRGVFYHAEAGSFG